MPEEGARRSHDLQPCDGCWQVAQVRGKHAAGHQLHLIKQRLCPHAQAAETLCHRRRQVQQLRALVLLADCVGAHCGRRPSVPRLLIGRRLRRAAVRRAVSQFLLQMQVYSNTECHTLTPVYVNALETAAPTLTPCILAGSKL